MSYILDRLLSVRKSLDALKNFMLDSFEVAEAVDWTDDFVGAFRAQHGYDPVPYLPALFDPASLDPGIAGRFLSDYRKTVSDLIIDNHFRAVRDPILSFRGAFTAARSALVVLPFDREPGPQLQELADALKTRFAQGRITVIAAEHQYELADCCPAVRLSVCQPAT